MGMSAVWIKNRDAIFPDDCIPPDLIISDLNGLIAADQGH